jgi:hypothetical protein
MMKSSAEMDRVLDKSTSKAGRFDNYAKVPFAAFAIVGMVAIWAMKTSGIEAIWTTGFAILMILGYALLVKSVVQLRIRDDQVGDNCYYLGFLYTLTSLAIALYQFTMMQSTSDAVSSIVASFGIALGSTIWGILMRVVINQNRRDAVEIEYDARMMMSRTLTDLSLGLNGVIITFRDFTEQSKQVVNDAMMDNVEKAGQAITQSSERISQASIGVIERIDQAFEAFSENTQRLNKVASGTVAALENLVGRLESMESPSDIISKRLESVTETVERAGQVLRDRLQADVSEMEKCSARVREIEQALRSSVEGFSQSGNGVQGIAESAQKAIVASDSAVKSLVALTSAMREALEAQKTLADNSMAAQEGASRGLIDGQRRLAQEIEESFRGLAGTLREHNEEMAKEVERARRMGAETGGALGDLAVGLTEKMRQMRQQRPAAGGTQQ